MNPVFWILVIIGAIIVFVALGSKFGKIGDFLFKIWDNITGNNGDEEDEEEEE